MSVLTKARRDELAKACNRTEIGLGSVAGAGENVLVPLRELRALIAQDERVEQAIAAYNDHVGFSSPDNVMTGILAMLRGDK